MLVTEPSDASKLVGSAAILRSKTRTSPLGAFIGASKGAAVNKRPSGAGKSSFDLVDVGKLFFALDLSPGDMFLDLGAGVGAYALVAAGFVTARGSVYAVDLWREGVEALREEAATRRLGHIIPKLADISKHIPLEDSTVDIALMSTVLHDLVRDGTHEAALQEVRRVLKPNGRLAVVEFRKMGGAPGPPVGVRLSPEEVQACLSPHGFDLGRTLEVGPYHYLALLLPASRAPRDE